MKERVESGDKKKVTLHLSAAVAKSIHDRAYPGKTQSKYIEDLVVADGRVERLDMERLRSVLVAVQSSRISLSDACQGILPIFGISKAGD